MKNNKESDKKKRPSYREIKEMREKRQFKNKIYSALGVVAFLSVVYFLYSGLAPSLSDKLERFQKSYNSSNYYFLKRWGDFEEYQWKNLLQYTGPIKNYQLVGKEEIRFQHKNLFGETELKRFLRAKYRVEFEKMTSYIEILLNKRFETNEFYIRFLDGLPLKSEMLFATRRLIRRYNEGELDEYSFAPPKGMFGEIFTRDNKTSQEKRFLLFKGKKTDITPGKQAYITEEYFQCLKKNLGKITDYEVSSISDSGEATLKLDFERGEGKLQVSLGYLEGTIKRFFRLEFTSPQLKGHRKKCSHCTPSKIHLLASEFHGGFQSGLIYTIQFRGALELTSDKAKRLWTERMKENPL